MSWSRIDVAASISRHAGHTCFCSRHMQSWTWRQNQSARNLNHFCRAPFRISGHFRWPITSLFFGIFRSFFHSMLSFHYFTNMHGKNLKVLCFKTAIWRTLNTATLTLNPIRKRKRFQKSLQKIFLSVELRTEITFISNIVSPMGVRRRLEALTDNSSKFQDNQKHLSPSTITPTLTLTLLKYPYPNLNLTPLQKLKLSVKLDRYSDFRGLNKFSTSWRVPNKCMTLGYSNTAVYVVYAHIAKCTWTDGYRESLKRCNKTTKCCTKWRQ